MPLPSLQPSSSSPLPVAVELPAALAAELQHWSELRGCSTAALIEELLRSAGFDSIQPGAGRCSTRLGRCSAGPLPLPVQQR